MFVLTLSYVLLQHLIHASLSALVEPNLWKVIIGMVPIVCLNVVVHLTFKVWDTCAGTSSRKVDPNVLGLLFPLTEASIKVGVRNWQDSTHSHGAARQRRGSSKCKSEIEVIAFDHQWFVLSLNINFEHISWHHPAWDWHLRSTSLWRDDTPQHDLSCCLPSKIVRCKREARLPRSWQRVALAFHHFSAPSPPSCLLAASCSSEIHFVEVKLLVAVAVAAAAAAAAAACCSSSLRESLLIPHGGEITQKERRHIFDVEDTVRYEYWSVWRGWSRRHCSKVQS